MVSMYKHSLLKSLDPLQLYHAISTGGALGSSSSSPGSPSASQQKQQEEALLYKHVLPLLAVLANELHMPARAIKYAAEMERAAAPSSPGSSKDEKENKMASRGFFISQ